MPSDWVAAGASGVPAGGRLHPPCPARAAAQPSCLSEPSPAAVARPRPPAALWLAEPEGFSLPSRYTALPGRLFGVCARLLADG